MLGMCSNEPMSIIVLSSPLLEAAFVLRLQNQDDTIFPAWETTVQQHHCPILEFSQRRPTPSRYSIAMNATCQATHAMMQPRLIN